MFADLEKGKKNAGVTSNNAVSSGNNNSQGKSSMKQKIDKDTARSDDEGSGKDVGAQNTVAVVSAPSKNSSKPVQIPKQSDSKPKDIKKPGGKWSLAFPLIATTSYPQHIITALTPSTKLH